MLLEWYSIVSWDMSSERNLMASDTSVTRRRCGHSIASITPLQRTIGIQLTHRITTLLRGSHGAGLDIVSLRRLPTLSKSVWMLRRVRQDMTMLLVSIWQPMMVLSGARSLCLVQRMLKKVVVTRPALSHLLSLSWRHMLVALWDSSCCQMVLIKTV